MKKIFIVFAFFSAYSFGNNSGFAAIDTMVEKIKKPRKGLEVETIEKVKDPFVVAKMSEKASEIVVSELTKPIPNFSLTAIINRYAHINGAWHKEGEKIMGYELKFVGTRGVVMTYEKRIVRLFLPEKTHLNKDIIKIEGEDE